MFHNKLALFLAILFFFQCSTTTRISSDPEGAHVFINEKSIGKTPLMVSRSDCVFYSHRIKLKLDGYHSVNSELEKEVKFGACIGGWFLLLPFLWVYGPKEVHHYQLEKDTNIDNNRNKN